MAIINPASAIIAKIKTKYGKRMTDKDFRAMVKCESVGDVVQVVVLSVDEKKKRIGLSIKQAREAKA